jgi:hypothetical protein
MRTASRTRTLPSETGCRRSTDANRIRIRIRTEVGCPACNVADAPRPGRGSAARCRMRTATHPQPHRDRRAACRRSWSTANRTETGCRSTAAAPRPGRCEPQAARERSPARPVADVQPMRTAPHRIRTETGCRSTAAAPRPGRCEPQAARERSPARPVADVQPMRTAPHPHRGRLPSVQRCRCTETWPR